VRVLHYCVQQVVQILEQPPARHVWAQRFLRLADDRGWVLENHPKVSFARRRSDCV
jgi:hypothetical protein